MRHVTMMTENTIDKDLVKARKTVFYGIILFLFEVEVYFQISFGDRPVCYKLFNDFVCLAMRDGADVDGSALDANCFHQLVGVRPFAAPLVEMGYLFPIVKTDEDSDDIVGFHNYRCFGDSIHEEE